MSPLRVVIADDQPLMRAGFKAVLEATGDIVVVAEAGTGAEAVDAARQHAPDVVLMDIRTPEMDGIEATRRLPRERILILTTFGLDEIHPRGAARRRERIPAQGRTDRPSRRGRARRGGRRRRPLTRGHAPTARPGRRRLPAPVSRVPDELAHFTDREREVLRLPA